MSDLFSSEPMLDMYLFETTQNIEQLETATLDSEKSSCYTPNAINEIFRIMHTIKGSSAMMLYNNISSLAHSMEDLFYYLREQKPQNVNCSTLSDLVLEGVDFIKVELQKVKDRNNADGDPSILIASNKEFLALLKQLNSSNVEMERPDSNHKQQYYIAHGKTHTISGKNAFKATIFFEDGEEFKQFHKPKKIKIEESLVKIPLIRDREENEFGDKEIQASAVQSIISVNVAKLDKLMDLVGEMVITEAMVTQNPDLKELQLENFQKSARQLHKITSELQGVVGVLNIKKVESMDTDLYKNMTVPLEDAKVRYDGIEAIVLKLAKEGKDQEAITLMKLLFRQIYWL